MTTGTIAIRWVCEPPPRDRSNWGAYDHNLIARTLRQRPGEWAELPQVGVNVAQTIRSGLHSAYRPMGAFEAVARYGVLYARYVGAEGGDTQ